MAHPNSNEHYISLDNQPYAGITDDFQEYSISIPLHNKIIPIKIDQNHIDDAKSIETSFALHIGLSFIENILLRSGCIAHWLKDHFYPQHHIFFQNELILNNDQEKQILNVIQCVENWPSIVFKNNKQIRQMLRNREWLAISGYSLYTIDNDGIANIYINLQLIEQASKATKDMQLVYGVMIGVKYLHEFSHFIYSKYGRMHLLNAYGIPLKDSIHTPSGVLRGESGNQFEEQMLGFVLSHAGHSNISMNIKMCLAHSKLSYHQRVIGLDFISKLLRKTTYDDTQVKPDFLHYSKIEFFLLERFSFDEIDDEDIEHDNEEQGELRVFIPAPDKIVL